jgi:hypothetical protein
VLESSTKVQHLGRERRDCLSGSCWRRFLSLEQLEDGFVSPIRVTAKALARISVRDECNFDTKTIELIAEA